MPVRPGLRRFPRRLRPGSVRHRFTPPKRSTRSRIAVTQEYPPDKLAWRIDPPQGAPSRWAADEPLAENVIDEIRLVDEMPGGDKEATGVLARNPRTPWPDLAPFSDVSVYGPGVEEVGSFRLDKAPESDGDHMAITPAAVGWQAALEDNKAVLGLGFIDRVLSKWGEIPTQRRINLKDAGINPSAFSSSVDPFGSGSEANEPAGISFTADSLKTGIEERGELVYGGGGVDIGEVLYDLRARSSGDDADWFNRLDLSRDGIDTDVAGTDHNALTALQRSVKATAEGLRYAFLTTAYMGGVEADPYGPEIFRWQSIAVLADHGLFPRGEWPDIGFTAKQMLGYSIPLHTPLRVTDESLEDDGFIIPQAWFSDPGSMAQVVQELTKYGLLDWFVRGERLFQLRFPGSYGRRWQAYAGPSELQEVGLDAARLWREIVVIYQDVDGSTRTVGPPGSGADVEDAALEITDPDHPAVRAGLTRNEGLALRGISTPARAREAGERWLEDGNQLSRSGSCVLGGYVMDDRGIFRPVSQVRSGDYIRFPDAADRSYRKITSRSYDHPSRRSSCSLDGPPEGIQALLERYQAALMPLGLG